MSQKKDTMNMIRELRNQGWEVTQAKRSGHWQAKAPDGKGITYFPGTPGDGRSLANTKAILRRLGAVIS